LSSITKKGEIESASSPLVGFGVKADAIEIFRASQLVINQLIGLYERKDNTLKIYYDHC
jgi:hypothetical protein